MRGARRLGGTVVPAHTRCLVPACSAPPASSSSSCPAAGLPLPILRLTAALYLGLATPLCLPQCTKVAENCVKLSPDACTCKYCNSGFSLAAGGVTCDAWCVGQPVRRAARGRAGRCGAAGATAAAPAQSGCRPRLPLEWRVCFRCAHQPVLPASHLAARLLARPPPSAPFSPPTPAPGELRLAGLHAQPPVWRMRCAAAASCACAAALTAPRVAACSLICRPGWSLVNGACVPVRPGQASRGSPAQCRCHPLLRCMPPLCRPVCAPCCNSCANG